MLILPSEPTVTISVKKDNNDKEKEKVLFTLVNGQVIQHIVKLAASDLGLNNLIINFGCFISTGNGEK